MSNEKAMLGVMAVVTVLAIAVCAGTIIYVNRKPEKEPVVKPSVTVKRKSLKTVPKKVEQPKQQVLPPSPPPIDKKSVNSKEMGEAMKEFAAFLQNSKFKDMIVRRMTMRNMNYLKDLFDKYSLDDKTRKAVASDIASAQFKFMGTLMEFGFSRKMSEDKRKEMVEKLTDIKQASDAHIIDLAGDAFLQDAQDKRNNELKDKYLSRVDRSLKENKMTPEQRNELDKIYAENQITEFELFTLPQEELKRRQQNIDSGVKETLTPEQYKLYKKSGNTAMPMINMGRGGFRRRRK